MNCALCLKNKPLCDSHIVPEFFYKPLYDDSPKRYYGISTNPDEHLDIKQKGVWKELLCEACERKLSVWENYARNVFYPEPDFQQRQDRLVITDLNYSKFKLFQLSVLWRASVTERKEFKYVDIGEHEETIRQMVSDNNPGKPGEYGCFMVTSPEHKNLLDQIMVSPEVKSGNGTEVAQFLMAGIFWNFHLSKTNPEMEEHAAFLTEFGMLSVFEDSAIIGQYLQYLAKRWKESGNLDYAIKKYLG